MLRRELNVNELKKKRDYKNGGLRTTTITTTQLFFSISLCLSTSISFSLQKGVDDYR